MADFEEVVNQVRKDIIEDLMKIKKDYDAKPKWKDTTWTSIYRKSKHVPFHVMEALVCKSNYKTNDIEKRISTYKNVMNTLVEILARYNILIEKSDSNEAFMEFLSLDFPKEAVLEIGKHFNQDVTRLLKKRDGTTLNKIQDFSKINRWVKPLMKMSE